MRSAIFVSAVLISSTLSAQTGYTPTSNENGIYAGFLVIFAIADLIDLFRG